MDQYKESIIFNMDKQHDKMNAKVAEALKIKKDNIKNEEELDSKKKEAIKKILVENEKLINNLTMEYNISKVDRKRVLSNLVDVLKGRIDKLLITGAKTASNLVMRYRCEYEVVDSDLVMKLFSDLIPTEKTPAELASTSSNADQSLWSDIDALNQELEELDCLNEDVKPKIETPDEEDEHEVTNITININPIHSEKRNDPQDTANKESAYYVNITIDPNRVKRFFITTRIILKKLKVHIAAYTDYVEFKTFQYVLRGIIEQRLAELLIGREIMKAKPLYELYREFYPIEDDHNFVEQILYEIWEGKYNDKEEPVMDPDKVKKEIDTSETVHDADDNEVSVKIETDAENNQDKAISANDGADKSTTKVKTQRVDNDDADRQNKPQADTIQNPPATPNKKNQDAELSDKQYSGITTASVKIEQVEKSTANVETEYSAGLGNSKETLKSKDSSKDGDKTNGTTSIARVDLKVEHEKSKSPALQGAKAVKAEKITEENYRAISDNQIYTPQSKNTGTTSTPRAAIKAEGKKSKETVLQGDKAIKTELIEDDDVIFVEDCPKVEDFTKKDIKSEDDVKVVEPAVEVIDLSDTDIYD